MYMVTHKMIDKLYWRGKSTNTNKVLGAVSNGFFTHFIFNFIIPNKRRMPLTGVSKSSQTLSNCVLLHLCVAQSKSLFQLHSALLNLAIEIPTHSLL